MIILGVLSGLRIPMSRSLSSDRRSGAALGASLRHLDVRSPAASAVPFCAFSLVATPVTDEEVFWAGPPTHKKKRRAEAPLHDFRGLPLLPDDDLPEPGDIWDIDGVEDMQVAHPEKAISRMMSFAAQREKSSVKMICWPR